jgi:hypothetical protein
MPYLRKRLRGTRQKVSLLMEARRLLHRLFVSGILLRKPENFITLSRGRGGEGMSEEVNPEQVQEQSSTSSGLLLSVEPLEGGGHLSATAADTKDTDTDMQDTSDAATDTDGTDESDSDGSDTEGGGDSDSSDTKGAQGDSDGTDVSADSDGSDS